MLGWPQVTSVSQLEVGRQEKPDTQDAHAATEAQITLRVTRKLERGYREILTARLPLLITVTGDLNEPRYPSLPAHLASLKAAIPIFDPHSYDSSLGGDEAGETTILEMHTPRPLPRWIAAPDSRHSAFERIGEIVSGGATGKSVRLVEGSPEELASALVEFLRERGFTLPQKI